MCLSLLLFKDTILKKDGDKIYNTCIVFSSIRKQLTKYRKVSICSIIVVINNVAVTAVSFGHL